MSLNKQTMQMISELLRRARLDQRINLATIAAQTRIDAKYLRAIEADDIKSLPGSFYYKSFVRQFARCLGLDTKAIDAEVDRVLASPPLPGIVKALKGSGFAPAIEPGFSPVPRLSLFWRLALEWMRGGARGTT